MKAHLIDTHLLVPRSRSSAKVKVRYQGHVSQKMGVSRALVFHKHILSPLLSMFSNFPKTCFKNITSKLPSAKSDTFSVSLAESKYQMACNTQKWTFGHLRKVSSRISLCYPRRLIRDNTSRLHYILC